MEKNLIQRAASKLRKVLSKPAQTPASEAEPKPAEPATPAEPASK